MQKDYQTQLEDEIEKRLTEMEQPDYSFPRRFSKRDYIITAAVIVICLAAVIAGAFII